MYANQCRPAPSEFNWLSEAMDNLFSGASGAVHEFPPVNVFANDNGAVIKAELPGVSAEELNVSVVNDKLTLKGARHEDALSEGERYLRSERLRGTFTRTLQLPFKIDGGAVTAGFEHGVLTVNVPRAESDKPRKIEVKVA